MNVPMKIQIPISEEFSPDETSFTIPIRAVRKRAGSPYRFRWLLHELVRAASAESEPSPTTGRSFKCAIKHAS